MSRRPPGPADHPLVQRVRYMRDPLGYLAKCQRELGDIFMLALSKHGMVIVCSPELAKAVYTAGDEYIVAGEAKIKVFGKVLGTSSTLLLDGAPHLERRRLLLPRFRGEIMQTFGPVMIDACRRTLDTMPRDRAFALHPFMHRTAFEVIMRALFATTPPDVLAPLSQTLREFANDAITSRLFLFPALQKDLGPWSPWGKVRRIVDRTRPAVLAEIRRRRRAATPTTADIVGLLLDAQDDNGRPLTDEEIRDEILTVVAAGHETTAMALTWLCSTVFTRHDILAKLRGELDAQKELGPLDVDRLPYLDAVCRESLRFNSLIPNGSGRLVKKPLPLGGYVAPAGAMLTIAFHQIHRRADVFERADEFWPERFLDAKYTPYESIAFGGGTRRCLGMPFALFEMKIVLATLIDQVGLEIVQRDIKPSWRGMFLTPSKGLEVRVRPRPPQHAHPVRDTASMPAPL